MQRAAGIAPDVRTYTSLISACGFSREPRTAMQLVRVLLARFFVWFCFLFMLYLKSFLLISLRSLDYYLPSPVQ